MTVFVHFDPGTGAIKQISEGHIPFQRDKHGVALTHFASTSEALVAIRDRGLRVDTNSLQAGELGWDYCQFIETSAAPLSVKEIKHARNMELIATDQYAVADRPDRSAWMPYRQSLRDLGKYETAAEMINAWPIRPDGYDAIAAMRLKRR